MLFSEVMSCFVDFLGQLRRDQTGNRKEIYKLCEDQVVGGSARNISRLSLGNIEKMASRCLLDVSGTNRS
jgi:hypothetical protein